MVTTAFDREKRRIQQEYQKHQVRLQEQRREAEGSVTGAAREQLSELERRQQELLGQVRTEEQRRRRMVAIGQRLPRAPLEAEKRRIESEAQAAQAEVEQARKEALTEIDKAVAEPAEELEKWKREATAAIDKAEAEFRAQNVELDTGEWVPREDFKALPKESQDQLKKLGIDKFNEMIAKEQAKAEETQKVAMAEFKADHVELDTGEWVTKDAFEDLDPQLQLLLKKEGTEKFTQEITDRFKADHVEVDEDLWLTKADWDALTTADQLAIRTDGFDKWWGKQEAMIAEFEANHVEVRTGEWYEKSSWESLTPAQRSEVLETGQYTPILTEASGRDLFNQLKAEGKIHDKAEYKGIKDNQVVYEIAWEQEVSLMGKALEGLGIPVPEWLKAPAMSQDFLGYVYEQQQKDDTPEWVKLIAESPLMYLTLLPEYKWYEEGKVGESPFPLSGAAPFWFSLLKQASEYPLAGVPYVTYDDKTDTYGYIAELGLPKWKFPKWKVTTPSLGTGKVKTVSAVTVAKPQLKPATVRPAPVKVTKLLSAKNAGMIQKQFDAFVKARAVTPGLTPKTYQFLTKVQPAGKKGQQLARYFFGKAKGAGLSRAEAEAGWALMKATKMKPLDAIKLGQVKQQQAVKALSEAAKAQAFYKGILPSYAEIIARGLPTPGEWKPWHSVAWQAARLAQDLNPQTFGQAVSLAGKTDAQWETMGARLAQSIEHLPAGRQKEVFGTLSMGLASQAAQAAGIRAKADGLSQAKAQKAVRTVMARAMQGLMAAAVKHGLLTKAEAKTLSRGTIQPQSMQGLAQSLGIMPAPAHAMTQPTPVEKPTPVTTTVTKPPTVTKPRVAKPVPTKKPVKKPPKTKKPFHVKVPVDRKKKPKKERERETFPKGTIVWKQGIFWRVIPPPYDLKKPLVRMLGPEGVTRLTGTPQDTLTFIGGKTPFANVAFDLGVTDGFIDVKKKTINFKGGGLETLVGKRIPSPTRGITLEDFKGRKITKEQARKIAAEKIKPPKLPKAEEPTTEPRPAPKPKTRKKAKGKLPTKEQWREHIDKVVTGL